MEQALNNSQLYLLKVLSYIKTDEELEQLKHVISEYFRKRAEDEMDKLWESGDWNEEKNEAILKEHLRTPYES